MMSILETEGTCEEIVPEDDEYDDDGNSNARMKTSAIGVSLLQILGELATIGIDIGFVFRRLATRDLFLALSIGNEFVEFILSLRCIDVDATEATRFTSGK